MDYYDIALQLERLRSRDSTKRCEACTALGSAPDLPLGAITALERASHDPDPAVANAARRALHAHWRGEAAADSTPERSPATPPLAEAPEPVHIPFAWWLFAIMMVVMAILGGSQAGWRMSLMVVIFALGCVALVTVPRLVQQRKLVEAWSELARHTGLTFYAGHKSLPELLLHKNMPSLRGDYRGRRLSLTVAAGGSGGGEYNVPRVYTIVSLQVRNRASFSLSIRAKGLLSRLFQRGDAASRDRELDQRLAIEGSPPPFRQAAIELVAPRMAVLLTRPRGITMRTAYPLSWTSWSPPAIVLEGSDLSCYQLGVATDTPFQVALLDLLCDLAELAEEMG